MWRLMRVLTSFLLFAAAAVPAMAQDGALAGFWTGTYRYDDQPQGSLQQFTKFTMCIVEDGQEFKGFLRESNTFGDEPALWTISVGGRVVGSLVCEAGSWRLSWFNGADPRLAAYAGPVDGNVESLAAALGARLGLPVRLESLPT